MSETVLIVGSGAREHAIALALARSAQQPKLLCFSNARNPGIASLCLEYGIGTHHRSGSRSLFRSRA